MEVFAVILPISQIIIKRKTSGAPGFMFLIKQPNHKLWNELLCSFLLPPNKHWGRLQRTQKRQSPIKLPIGEGGISIKLRYYCGEKHWYFIPSTY